ncbi:cell division protein FtsL [Melghirimyces profundicolus]|uniref:Cell division protein FtsL n=1 Tax=Melghirimyces profundicolus TaxID=1242148 RepID=A0A2T6B5C9_9BACL|nr:hypothetical protein [Melghirimyces profundicolus]PTX51245.1 cell division protein FtsL [Melghirimyces profundicolus]
MREYRGNTSVAYQLEPQPKVAARKEKQPQTGLPAGEKLLYLASVVICVALASGVLSLYAKSAEINMETQKVAQQAEELKEANRGLTERKNELKSGERIRQFALDKGMVPADKTVPGAEKPDKKRKDSRG